MDWHESMASTDPMSGHRRHSDRLTDQPAGVLASNEYHLVSRWRLQGTVDEVAAVLRHPADLARWWPAVFLAVDGVEHGDENELGTQVWVHTKGWLPYTLHFNFEIVAARPPYDVTIQVRGDLDGRCHVSVEPQEQGVHVTWDWTCHVRKRLVRRWEWLLRPIFVSNHRWTMRQGLASLRLELERRRQDGHVPARSPRGPTFPHDRWTTRLASLTRG